MRIYTVVQNPQTVANLMLEENTSEDKLKMNSKDVSGVPIAIEIVDSNAEEKCHINGFSVSKNNAAGGIPEFDSKLALDESIETSTVQSGTQHCQVIDSCHGELCSEHVESMETRKIASDSVGGGFSGTETMVITSSVQNCQTIKSRTEQDTSNEIHEMNSVRASSDPMDIQILEADTEEMGHNTGDSALKENTPARNSHMDSELAVGESMEITTAGCYAQNCPKMNSCSTELCSGHVQGDSVKTSSGGSDCLDVVPSGMETMITGSVSPKCQTTGSPILEQVTADENHEICFKHELSEPMDIKMVGSDTEEKYHTTANVVPKECTVGGKPELDSEHVLDEPMETGTAASDLQNVQVTELYSEHVINETKESKFVGSGSVDVELSSNPPVIATENSDGMGPNENATSSRSKKRKLISGLSPGTVRVLRPRLNGLCKTPDTTSVSANVSGEKEKKRKKRKRKTTEALDNVFSKTRKRLRYFLTRMGYERNFIDAYSGDGWKGQSVEKIKPEKELQRATSEILKCKSRIRELFQHLDSSCAEGKFQESLFDSEGQISSEDIFCAKCGSKETSADNDIILCDGICDRGFHQMCLEPPLLKEEIPPDDEGWLCPGCDCKVDCIDLLNDSQGTNLSLNDTWEKVFPEAAATAAGNIDDISGLPSDDSEDDEYNPDASDGEQGEEAVNTEGSSSKESDDSSSEECEDSDFTSASDDAVVRPTDGQYLGLPSDDSEDDEYDPNAPDLEQSNEESSSSDFSSASEYFSASSDDNGTDKGTMASSFDDLKLPGSGNRRSKMAGSKKLSVKSELLSILETDNQQEPLAVSGKRQRERLDYRKLHDEEYGNVPSESSDDEDWVEAGDTPKGKAGVRKESSSSPIIDSQVNIRGTGDAQMIDSKETGNTKRKRGRPRKSLGGANKSAAEVHVDGPEPTLVDKIATTAASKSLGEAVTREAYGKVPFDSSDDKDWVEADDTPKQKGDGAGEESSFSPKTGSQANMSRGSTEDAQKADLEETGNTKKIRGRPKKNFHGANNSTAKTDIGSPALVFVDKIATASASKALGEAVTQRLYESFKENEYPKRATKESLAAELGISFQQVTKWFGNARWCLRHSSSDPVSETKEVAGTKDLTPTTRRGRPRKDPTSTKLVETGSEIPSSAVDPRKDQTSTKQVEIGSEIPSSGVDNNQVEDLEMSETDVSRTLKDERGVGFDLDHAEVSPTRDKTPRKLAEPGTETLSKDVDCNKVEDRELSEVGTPKTVSNGQEGTPNEAPSSDRGLVISLPANSPKTEQVPKSGRKKDQKKNQVVAQSRIQTRSRKVATPIHK